MVLGWPLGDGSRGQPQGQAVAGHRLWWMPGFEFRCAGAPRARDEGPDASRCAEVKTGWPQLVTEARALETDTAAARLKPSCYNHYTDTADPERFVIFNKFWGSIAVVDASVASAMRDGDAAAIPEAELAELAASGFLVDADLDEVKIAHERYMDSKRNNALLSITIELTQACNLACTYCYQNSYRKPGAISDDITDKLGSYVRSVVDSGRRPITGIPTAAAARASPAP